jgi:dienelactone hydrolase
MTVQVYPGANHEFDTPGDLHNYAGHMLGYNAAAAADAQVRVTQFLRRYMQ